MASAVPRLHLVTPPDASVAVLEAIEAGLDAGAPLIQVRTKDVGDRERFAHARAAVALIRDAGAVALINDRVDIALATEADGVHLGADDVPVEVARRLLGSGAIVGATCRSPADARCATAAGADYIGVGPAYATTTKTGLPDPLGPGGVGAVAAATHLPAIAISGVTVERVPELLAAGAHGVAVVGAVFSAPDIAVATQKFLGALS